VPALENYSKKLHGTTKIRKKTKTLISATTTKVTTLNSSSVIYSLTVIALLITCKDTSFLTDTPAFNYTQSAPTTKLPISKFKVNIYQYTLKKFAK
jgi:hypothetical protein